MNTTKIIEKIFQSEDMKKYLIENASELKPWQIKQMVASAPISIDRKKDYFRFLATGEDLAAVENWEESYHDYLKAVQEAEKALVLEGRDVFSLCGYRRDGEEAIQFESVLFYSLEKVMQYLQENYSEVEERNYWHILEKWECDETGNLTATWEYCIIDQEICYFTNSQFNKGNKTIAELVKFDFWGSKHLNLPVPFQSGDIILVNGEPFAEPVKVKILEVGDNRDCCSVQVEYRGSDKKEKQGALKHGCMYECKTPWAVSPLYRAKRIIKGEEKALAEKIWGQLLEEMKEKVTCVSYETWIRPSKVVTCTNGKLIIAVESGLFKDMIEKKYVTMMNEMIQKVSNEKIDIMVEVDA